MPVSQIEQPLPVARYASTPDAINRFAPSEPGIILFYDKNGEFWFSEQAPDIKFHLLMIREDWSNPRRQGVHFAFEKWPDAKEREARWHYILDHFLPSGQTPCAPIKPPPAR
jgi:hypothetical protein